MKIKGRCPNGQQKYYIHVGIAHVAWYLFFIDFIDENRLITSYKCL